MKFAKLIQFLLELVRAEFYGTVHIQFRNGKIGIVKKEETFEPDQLPVKDLDAVAMMESGRLQLPTVAT